ncbi:MAG: hypothetical protein QM730_04025 [Anaerolineales bacterium]
MISSSHQNPIEKQYLYQSAWSQTLIVLSVGGLGAFGMAWLALSKNIAWFWFLAAFFLCFFLLGVWITIVNIQGKLRFMISKEGIYLPLAWNSQRHTFVRFSEVSDVEFLEFQGNTIFQVSVGNKKYPITKSWFPDKGDFQEIVDIIQARLPAQLKQSTG